jgi:hypothetical protein
MKGLRQTQNFQQAIQDLLVVIPCEIHFHGPEKLLPYARAEISGVVLQMFAEDTESVDL